MLEMCREVKALNTALQRRLSKVGNLFGSYFDAGFDVAYPCLDIFTDDIPDYLKVKPQCYTSACARCRRAYPPVSTIKYSNRTLAFAMNQVAKTRAAIPGRDIRGWSQVAREFRKNIESKCIPSKYNHCDSLQRKSVVHRM